MTPRLILVDGFAGTGKSTTAQRLWLDLIAGGRRAAWYHEHQADHPIFQYDEVDDLLRWSPDRLEAHLLGVWDTFARRRTPTVRIVEGALFQIPVGVMLAMNAPVPRIHALIRGIAARIARLDPALVYLHQPDLRRAFHVLRRERGQAWIDDVTGVVARSPYGRRHKVRDIRGLTDFYRRQRAIVDEIFQALDLKRLAIDVGDRQWTRHARRMSTFLEIRQARPPAQGLASLRRHAGQYTGRTSGEIATVTTDTRALYLEQPGSSALPLLRIGPGHYCVEGLPIDVRFSYGAGGSVRRFTYESRMVNETLVDRSWMRA